MQAAESVVVKEFFNKIDAGQLSKDLKILYRVTGGAPGERFEEEVDLTADGNTQVMMRDMLKSPKSHNASAKLDVKEVQELLNQLRTSVDSLVPASQARFLPDSMVGSITVEIEGKKATFYFLADEEERAEQKQPITSNAKTTIDKFEGLSQRLLKIK